MIALRPYQLDAVEAVFRYLREGREGNPLVEVPTGGGKSAILGEITRRLVQDHSVRVVVVTHRAELIEQDADAISRVWPEAPVGIYSASLSSRSVDKITVCGVQSVYRRHKELGKVDVVIVDEAHLVNVKSGTQYARFIEGLRERSVDLAVIGLTATPYRLGQGLLTSGEDKIFSSVCYRIPVMRLVDEGYLSPLVSGAASAEIDASGVRTSGGEYVLADLELAADLDAVTDAVAADVSQALRSGRRAALVYGVGVEHAAHLRNALRLQGVSCELVTGETDRSERRRILDDYRAGRLQAIASCDVLTTGFDAPVTDVIALVRPTQSPGLYVQMLGRGMRLADGKRDCLVLDYGGNIARHGPITDVRTPKGGRGEGSGKAPVRYCPDCYAECPASARRCAHCDFDFPEPEKKANREASKLSPMEREALRTEHDVHRVEWHSHTSRQSGLTSLRIDYWSEPGASLIPARIASEYVCLEHDGFAQRKAHQWWRDVIGHGEPPTTVHEALAILDDIEPSISRIVVEPDGKWLRVVGRSKAEFDEDAWNASRLRREEEGDASAPLPSSTTESVDAFDDLFGDDLPF